MAEVDVAFNLFSASAVLYGFVLAYYAFARGMQDQLEWRLQDQLIRPTKPTPKDEFDNAVRRLNRWRFNLDGFFVVTTLLAIVTLGSGVLYLFTTNPDYVTMEGAGLVVMLGVTLASFAYVGVRRTLKDWRTVRGRL